LLNAECGVRRVEDFSNRRRLKQRRSSAPEKNRRDAVSLECRLFSATAHLRDKRTRVILLRPRRRRMRIEIAIRALRLAVGDVEVKRKTHAWSVAERSSRIPAMTAILIRVLTGRLF